MAALRLKPGDTVVDVGCGTGHLIAQMRERGYVADGVIPSERLARRVSARLESAPGEPVAAQAKVNPPEKPGPKPNGGTKKPTPKPPSAADLVKGFKVEDMHKDMRWSKGTRRPNLEAFAIPPEVSDAIQDRIGNEATLCPGRRVSPTT